MNWENGVMSLEKHFMNGTSLSVPVHIPSRLDQRGFYFSQIKLVSAITSCSWGNDKPCDFNGIKLHTDNYMHNRMSALNISCIIPV